MKEILSERPTDVVDGELVAMRILVENTLGDRYRAEILGGEIIVPPAARTLLVVEVTAPNNAHDDRTCGPKYKAYAKGLVPVYLLVDPHHADDPSFTLYTEPDGTRYQGEQTLSFGRSIRLPAPFDTVVVDSAAFPAPRKSEG